MSVEVEAAILKIRAELTGDALKQVDKELKKLGLTVAKTGKDGSESLVKIDKDSWENKHLRNASYCNRCLIRALLYF